MRKCLVVCWLVLGLMGVAQADNAQMKTTLVKIINQLETIKPLVTQAKREQTANPRVKIHFDRWQDGQGHWHNGLRQDIETIQGALVQAVNQQNHEPRVIAPLSGDFVGGDHV